MRPSARRTPTEDPLARANGRVGAAVARDDGILDEPLLDAQDVAMLLGIPKASVYEYARDGRLPCVCNGRHKKFVRRDPAEAVARMRSGL